jgi:GT2 family glycosyltransferase
VVQTSREAAGALAVPKIICFYDQKRLDHYIGPEINWWTAQPVGYHYYPNDQPSLNIRSDIRVASTCCLLVPSPVFSAVGKMDENYFMYHDDSDFTLRASRAGYRMIYEPQAVIYHKCNMTTQHKQPAFFQYYLLYRNVFYFYGKLCDRPLIKFLFLTKCAGILFVHYLQSYFTRDVMKRTIIKRIVRDIFEKKMGPPPDFNSLR